MDRSKNFLEFPFFAAGRLRIWLIFGSRRTEGRRQKAGGSPAANLRCAPMWVGISLDFGEFWLLFGGGFFA